MNKTLFVTIITVAVALSGCASQDSGASQEELEAAQSKGYQIGYKVGKVDGYSEAEEVFNPPIVEHASRDDYSTLDIAPNGHKEFLVTVPEISTLEYTVQEYTGQAFDVFAIREQRYAEYVAGELTELQLADHVCSDLYARSTSNECRLNTGSWYIIIDNTVQGAAAPDVEGDGYLRMKVEYLAWS